MVAGCRDGHRSEVAPRIVPTIQLQTVRDVAGEDAVGYVTKRSTGHGVGTARTVDSGAGQRIPHCAEGRVIAHSFGDGYSIVRSG